MMRKCSCGGELVRTDVVHDLELSKKFGRPMYRDTDQYKANWRCTGCGAVRTQRKRQPARRAEFQHD